MIHHYITRYRDEGGRLWCEAWVQFDAFGRCWCLSKRRIAIE